MRSLSIDLMREVATLRGGECLSGEYINAHTSMLWKCKEGHIWKTRSDGILRGKWCPTCARKRSHDWQRLSISIMSDFVAGRGRCLSDEYVNAHSKLLWECNKGHTWLATSTHIRSGNWCPLPVAEGNGETWGGSSSTSVVQAICGLGNLFSQDT